MWDIEVDLVSVQVGAGVGGLAGAIATVDSGGRALVADTTSRRAVAALLPWRPQTRPLHSRLAAGRGERHRRPTSSSRHSQRVCRGPAYLTRGVPVPTRIATASPDSDAVEPFLGSRLMDWAGQCLTSPYGMLHSSVFGWDRCTRMRSEDGGAIEVVPIGTIDWRRGLGGQVLRDWMLDRVRGARDRDAHRHRDGAARVRGWSRDGCRAVDQQRSARRACPPGSDHRTPRARARPPPVSHPLGKSSARCAWSVITASRFGRVELLSSAAARRRAAHVPGSHGCRRVPRRAARRAAVVLRPRAIRRKCTGTRPWASSFSIASPDTGRDSRKPWAR